MRWVLWASLAALVVVLVCRNVGTSAIQQQRGNLLGSGGSRIIVQLRDGVLYPWPERGGRIEGYAVLRYRMELIRIPLPGALTLGRRVSIGRHFEPWEQAREPRIDPADAVFSAEVLDSMVADLRSRGVECAPEVSLALAEDRSVIDGYYGWSIALTGVLAIAYPLWGLAAIMGAGHLCRSWRSGRRDAGRCPNCGYDVRGTGELRCPECGHIRERYQEPLLCRAQAGAIANTLAGLLQRVRGKGS